MKYKTISDNWIKQNVNPKNRKTGDCVIRAVAVATGQTWDEAFDGLAAIARKHRYSMDDTETVHLYLAEHGFVKMSLKVAKGDRRKIVRELARELHRNAVLRVAGHLVATDGMGHFVDTWDCGSNSVYFYWIKK